MAEPLKIAVVGMAPSTKDEALSLPRPEWQIWGLNTLFNTLGDHWDRWYEIHNPDWLRGRPGINPETDPQGYWKFLHTDHGKPIYMASPDPQIPNAVQYPLKEIVDRYGRWLPDGRPYIYFQSTVDWMLANALLECEKHEGPCEVAVLGVDMALGEEYAHQRPSGEFWIGKLSQVANVYIPDRCDLLKIKYIYGIDSYEPVALKMQQRRKELEQRLAMAANQEAQQRDTKMALRGALDDLNWIEQQRY
jgi:hypothetical protein